MLNLIQDSAVLEPAGRTQQVSLLISRDMYLHLPSFYETKTVFCFCFQETEPLLTGTSKLKQALGASQTSSNRWTRGSSNYKSVQLNLFYIINPSYLKNLTAVMCVQSDAVAVLWVQSLRLLTQRLTSQWRNDSAVCLSALEVLGGLAKVETHTHSARSRKPYFFLTILF